MTYSIASLPGLLPATKVTELAPREVLLQTVAKARAVLLPPTPYDTPEAGLKALRGLMTELYPSAVAQMQQCCADILDKMSQVSDDSVTFEQAFSGYGPLAQRLGAIAFYERLLPAHAAVATQALTLFDHHLVREPSVLERQRALVKALQWRIAPDSPRWIPNRYFMPQTSPLQESGFYGVTSEYGVVYLCHLHVTLDSGIEVMASAATERGFSLYARHPQEGQWFQSDCATALPGSVEALWAQYERCLKSLRLLDTRGEVTFTSTLKRAWGLLRESKELSDDWFGFARTEGQCEFGFNAGSAQLYVISRGENDPERISRVTKIYDRGQAGFFFSIPFSELNAEEQTMLLTQANRDMDDVQTYLFVQRTEQP